MNGGQEEEAEEGEVEMKKYFYFAYLSSPFASPGRWQRICLNYTPSCISIFDFYSNAIADGVRRARQSVAIPKINYWQQ